MDCKSILIFLISNIFFAKSYHEPAAGAGLPAAVKAVIIFATESKVIK